jgi:RHS repeat-associated protein
LKVSTTATWTYGWDNMNHLLGVKQVTATGTQLSVSYSYDVLGKRVVDDTWKPGTGTVTVRHAYDANNIWADVTTTNTLLARYVYGDGVDQVWARAIPAGQPNSGVAWYLTDRLGSVRDIMDSSSVIQDHIDNDGYGNPTHTTITVGDQFGYAGGLYSYDTKMEQFGARWYDPATGRWVSQDPMGFGAGDTNLQRYCGNEPTNATDPSGLDSKKGTGSGTGPTPGAMTGIAELENAPKIATGGGLDVLVLVDAEDKHFGEWTAHGLLFLEKAKYYPYIDVNETSFETTVEVVERVVATYGKIKDLRIYDHGFHDGDQQVGDIWLKEDVWDAGKQDLVRRLGKCIQIGGTLSLYGCKSGSDRIWLQAMADAMPHIKEIRASTKQCRWPTLWGTEPAIDFDVHIRPKVPPRRMRR